MVAPKEPDFQGRTVIITGAARGIGLTYAEAFAARGASVAIADIVDTTPAVKRLQESGANVIGLHTDVTDPASVEKMAASVHDRWGRIDVLVNNAAVYRGMQRKSWDEIDLDEWNRHWRVNVLGIYLCCRAVVPYMKAVGRGKIVNIASGVAHNAPPGMLAYNVSKGAVITLTRGLARELGDASITVNSVSPGMIANDATMAQTSEEYLDNVIQQRALKRAGYPADVVGAVLFFASEASDFITGQDLVVDGGILFH